MNIKKSKAIGAFLIAYALLWVGQRCIPISGVLYLQTLFAVTTLFGSVITWSAFRPADPHVWLNGVVSVISGMGAAFVVCVATIFNPIGTRPSPIGLPEDYLLALEYGLHVTIASVGLVLVCRKSSSATKRRTLTKYFLAQFFIVFIPVTIIGGGLFGLLAKTGERLDVILEVAMNVMIGALGYATLTTWMKGRVSKDG